MLSQHADCILHINELNKRPYMSKRMHHDYLTKVLSKRKRFARLSKPTTTAEIELIQEVFSYSKEKALAVRDLFSDDDIATMRASRERGGISKKR